MGVDLKINGNFLILKDSVTGSDRLRLPRQNVRFLQTKDGEDVYFQFLTNGFIAGKTILVGEAKFLFSDIIDDRTGLVFNSVNELEDFLNKNLGDFFFNKQDVNLTPYNEQLIAEKTTLIELKSIYGISKIRDIVTEFNTGAVTNDFREYKLAVSAATDEARLTSTERGRYIAGKSAEYGIGIRTDVTSVTGDTELKWGAFNDTNGIYFGLDSTGIFVSILDDGTEIDRIYQADWNQDKLNGTGASGQTLDLTKGNIFQAQYTWYGYGIITFRVQLKTIEGMELINVHNYIVDEKVSINDPNLPLTAEVKQTTATNTVNLYVGGRQFSILGTYIPNFRNTSEYIVNKSVPTLSGTPIPLITFKHKAAYKAISAKLGELSFATDNSCIFEVYLVDPADLTGASFTTPTRTKATETGFETDTSATAIDITNADLIYRLGVKGGDRNTTNQADFANILLDAPENRAMCITGFAESSNATISALMRLIEEW